MGLLDDEYTNQPPQAPRPQPTGLLDFLMAPARMPYVLQALMQSQQPTQQAQTGAGALGYLLNNPVVNQAAQNQAVYEAQIDNGVPAFQAGKVLGQSPMMGWLGTNNVGRSLPGITGSPPPTVQSAADLDALRSRVHQMAQEGAAGKDWYTKSAQTIGQYAGDPERADKFAQELAIFSPQAPVATNAEFATRAWNQGMAGEPVHNVGIFPTQQTSKANAVLAGDTWSGRKTNSFYRNIMALVDPKGGHEPVTTDIWMMRAFEYPGKGDKLYTGSPSKNQYDFVETETARIANELGWTPPEVQAAVWTAAKVRNEGLSPEKAAFDFADALKGLTAQQSWESIPGRTARHFPEMFDAPLEQRAEYHEAMRRALTDAQGRDLISAHLGLLTGPTVDAPGAFQGATNPGSQAQSVVGQVFRPDPATGKPTKGRMIDPASRDLLETAELVRGIVLKQDAVAFHKPYFQSDIKVGDKNFAEIQLGRPLHEDETIALMQAVARHTGSDFFSPIGSPAGARFMNIPDFSGLDNKTFQKKLHEAVQEVFGRDDIPGTVTIKSGAADGWYYENDWSKSPNGEDYFGQLQGRRPDLQRRATELLAALRPRVSQVEQEFAKRFGWTPSERAAAEWQQVGQQVTPQMPEPPAPWQGRGAASYMANARPGMFGGP